ncbi:MAG TPA: hypothetical protein VIV60_21820 [Polyangiaceae bacterium]
MVEQSRVLPDRVPHGRQPSPTVFVHCIAAQNTAFTLAEALIHSFEASISRREVSAAAAKLRQRENY